MSAKGPLSGITVLDFSTLLPGPLATLILSESGAEVIRVERPGVGEAARGNEQDWDETGIGFALLNHGKRSLALDLKSPEALAVLRPLIEKADIVVEQFRPGVMARLGLDYDAVRKIRPDIIYCSITGYGQTGPKALAAGHDLNYMAESGVLSASYGTPDRPTISPALVADVGGGSYPAVINILLALRQRDQTGKGCHIDVAMAEGVFTFSYRAFAKGAGLGRKVHNGGELLTGGSPRYQLYAASDRKMIAMGGIEQKFWDAFCEAIGLDINLRDDGRDPVATITRVAEIIAGQPSQHWARVLDEADCCCSIMAGMDEATANEHFAARGIFDHQIVSGSGQIAPAIPLPISPELRTSADQPARVSDFGEYNGTTDPKNPSTTE